MNILVTAGNTQVLIDQVRCITNIFTGRTGASIARAAVQRDHHVTLLTSHPETVDRDSPVVVYSYRTFADLRHLMQESILRGHLDCVIHCAAVSDYQSAGIFAPSTDTRFDPDANTWQRDNGPPQLLDRSAGKVKSDQPELWLRLVRTPKLVDLIRSEWGFRGILVKFKLEVGITQEQLIKIAEQSRLQSSADLMVANTLEGAQSWAVLGPLAGGYQRVERAALAKRLLDEVESLQRERHG